MKVPLCLFLVGFCLSLQAQSLGLKNDLKTNYSVAYWGYNGFHPGVKIGASVYLKKQMKHQISSQSIKTKSQHLFMRPEIGFYSQRRNHQAFLYNLILGKEYRKEQQRFYKAFSAGIGFLAQRNANTTYVQIDEESFVSKTGAIRRYMMPSLNVEYGQRFTQFSWFNEWTLASKLKYNTAVSFELFITLGLKYTWTKNTLK